MSPPTAPIASLLRRLESSANEGDRLRAIDELAAVGDSSACRALIDAFQRSVWRSTKLAVLRALARIRQQRGIEFLLRVATDRDDLALGLEAVLALGATQDAVAGEFLLTILGEKEHPLRREAIIALTEMSFFPCVDDLVALLDRPAAHNPPAVVQYALLGLARLGRREHWPVAARYLVPDRFDEGGPVFNAALLAAGELGGEEALATLEALDTRYRFFAHHLKLAAMTRIRQRLWRGLEDILAELLAATTVAAQRDAARALGHFPPETAWEACELLAAEAPPNARALARTILFRTGRKESDRAFLVAHATELDPEVAGMLVRLHVRAAGTAFSDPLYAAVPRAAAIAWMSRVKEPAALARLDAIATDPETRFVDQVLAINAMVAQAQMAGQGTAEVARCGELFLAQIERHPEGPVRSRLIRALGQIGHADRATLQALERWIKQRDPAFASVYHTLAALGGEAAARIVLRRLRAVGDDHGATTELGHVMATLARLGPLPETEALRKQPRVRAERLRPALLQILAHNRIEGFEEVVREALTAEDFQTRMLGAAAARYNHDEAIWQELLRLAGGEVASLAERALDSLCLGGGLRQHRRLLDGLTPGSDRGRALKILRTLSPEPGGDYRPLVAHLDRQLEAHEGVFQDKEVVGSATHLRDSLVFQSQQHARRRRSYTPVNEAALHIHDLDQNLTALLPGYGRFNELVRSALRNAELTFHHPELFDGSVDKSTMVVEYVKSIDLLLQERIGAQIFFGGESAVLRSMQSRVVYLELEDDQLANDRLVQDLDCATHFDPDDFPGHKLTTLSRSILSGKILHEQHRMIDGPRAWGLILLIFGRRFQFRQLEVEPLFAMRTAENRRICGIAADLNRLQGLRNDAAHRGTILQARELEEVRGYSLRVLADLERVLA